MALWMAHLEVHCLDRLLGHSLGSEQVLIELVVEIGYYDCSEMEAVPHHPNSRHPRHPRRHHRNQNLDYA